MKDSRPLPIVDYEPMPAKPADAEWRELRWACAILLGLAAGTFLILGVAAIVHGGEILHNHYHEPLNRTNGAIKAAEHFLSAVLFVFLAAMAKPLGPAGKAGPR